MWCYEPTRPSPNKVCSLVFTWRDRYRSSFAKCSTGDRLFFFKRDYRTIGNSSFHYHYVLKLNFWLFLYRGFEPSPWWQKQRLPKDSWSNHFSLDYLQQTKLYSRLKRNFCLLFFCQGRLWWSSKRLSARTHAPHPSVSTVRTHWPWSSKSLQTATRI